ncbi:hypothetical protein GW796_07985 [archaeon]|nr:hypothetical protein [archaeon]
MKRINYTLEQELLVKDIVESFDIFTKVGEPRNLNFIWQNLFHAKEKKWFTNDYYEYWLVRCISATFNQTSFILCQQAITKKICGFSEESLAVFLIPRIDFLISVNDFERAISWLSYSLEGGNFFEISWIKNLLKQLNIENSSSLIELNSKNYAIYLNKSIKKI